MNQLQFYTEHTFAYPGCEEVWEGTGALTPEEVLELAEYAHARFVELVPNQQSFGHLQHWLKLDKWKHLAELPEGTSNLFTGDYCCAMWDDPENMPNILSPDNASLAFLNERFAALLTAFPLVNVRVTGHADAKANCPREKAGLKSQNADDSQERDKAGLKSQNAAGFQRFEDAHFGDTEADTGGGAWVAVYVAFLRSIAALAKDNFNTTIQWWGDVDAEQQNAGDAAPPTGIIMEWGYEAHHPFKQRGLGFQRRKQRFYVAPGTSAWNSIGGRLSNSFSNIANAAASAASTGAEGLLLTDWGDNGHVQRDCS
ncbi:glycoside hydrolase superfamily [Baffinella frigidus]|nr:glycoside hydrolase superfamily [Cryptophyta sp. CCMP2293]